LASPRNDFPTEVFVRRSEMPVSAEALYRWHERPDVFEKLLPPGDPTRVEHWAPIADGSEMILRVRVGPLPVRWVARLYDVVPGRQFRDLQIEGPFRFWLHSHLFEPIDEGRSMLEDRVTWSLRGGRLAHAVAGWFVRRTLQRLFEHRHEVTRRLVQSTP
jgi:ligand-binding SRPBCC domain-containing protein